MGSVNTKEIIDMSTILLVDPHPEREQSLAELLQPHDVIRQPTPADAWEYLAHASPMLVLVDYQVLGWTRFMRLVTQRVNQHPPQLAGIADLDQIADPVQRLYIRVCACQVGGARGFFNLPLWLRSQMLALLGKRFSALG
jgi:CheY-like chemotaxis protein